MLLPVSLEPFSALKEWECFDADTGRDSAKELREYFVPDFYDWRNPDSYQATLGRLLRDLLANT